MKPHLAHIQNTLIKKRLADEARDIDVPLEKYRKLVEKARADGYDTPAVIIELQAERFRIKTAIHAGDALFLKGVENAQAACIVAIDKIISELRGEN